MAESSVVDSGWIDRVQAIGKPLLLGLALFAVGGGIAAWGLVHLAWRLAVRLEPRRRNRRAERTP